VTDLAVNGAGDAVLAFLGFNFPADLEVAYRHRPSGAFDIHSYPITDATPFSARVAINAGGSAVVLAQTGLTTLHAVTRTATGGWPTTLEDVENQLQLNSQLAIKIDDAGNALAAFTYRTSAFAIILRTARRPATGGPWIPSEDLSPTTPMEGAGEPEIVANPSGFAALVWKQVPAGSNGLGSIKALYGTTIAGMKGQAEDVSDVLDVDAGGTFGPAAAIGDDGSVVAVWQRMATGEPVWTVASVRSPGAAGTWGPLHSINPSTTPAVSISSDGLGDYAVLVAPSDGTSSPVQLSFYDTAPPILTPAPGGDFDALAHIQTTLTTVATDAWSSVGVPAWTFGDGATGSGLSVTHAYPAGRYGGQVSVTDAAGNVGTAQFSATATQAKATLARARFTATWKRSRVRGTLTISGRAPVAGRYTLNVARGKKRRIHVTIALPAGAFSRVIPLPGTLFPGTHTVTLIPANAFVKRGVRTAALRSPPEGVVDGASFSRTRAGKATRVLSAASSLWARFHLVAIPRGKPLTLTWYRILEGKRMVLRAVSKKPAATVQDSLRVRGVRGVVTAVLTRAGRVIFQQTVTLRQPGEPLPG